ncbi:hypothetical protein FNO01nite_21030 [Flavobacterium noncentrifugens]|nr:hypothetical protein FNO01nite_21030 [Flavobacterium noncentrifugens]
MQTTVGSNPSTVYSGAGFAPAPTTAGRLNSNAWEVKGWSFGTLLFGDTQTVDDFGRGSVSGGVITPGMYALTTYPGTATNPMLLIQTGPSDMAPGSVTLKIKNNGTTNITQLNLSYNLFVQNDENSSTSVKFAHSDDNVTFVDEPTLDYTSPDVADAFQWVNVSLNPPSRTLTLNGVTIEPGTSYYIRWAFADVTVSGDRDELGLDDIEVSAVYGPPAPEINVQCYGNNLLTGDVTPTVAKGTDFAPIGSPLSTLSSNHIISYYIYNLGGAPLNISGITITGPQASDFTIIGVPPTGNIAPGGSVAVNVSFDPSAAGLRQARLNINNNDSNENPYFFDIQGYGVVPIPDIRVNGNGGAAPSNGFSIVTGGSMVPALNNNTQFSSLIVGVQTEVKGFKIRNDCPYNAPLILTGPSPYITITGANPSDFTIQLAPYDSVIYPGEVMDFSIKFSPTATGLRSALISIANNDPDVSGSPIESPFVFLVQGTGVASKIEITGNAQPVANGTITTSLANHTFFDYVNVTSGTIDRTFTVKNSGNVALTLGALTLTGAQASDFSITATPAASVAIGATTTFTIRFDPSAVGLRNATVNLVTNDATANPFRFAISGFGVDYVPCAYGVVETIAIQNFETAAAIPNWLYNYTGAAVSGGTAFGQTGDAGSSPMFLGTAKSLQVTNGTGVLIMNGINTNAYSDIELNVKLASFGVTAAEGSDAADKVTVAVRTNSAAPWSDEIQVLGNSASKWSFASGTGVAATVYDGNLVATQATATAGYATTSGFSTISLTGLPKAANLEVRITLVNDNANEIWAVDNVTLFGRQVVSAIWNGLTWTPGAPTATTKAIIQGPYNTSLNGGNITACQCEIKAGGSVTIADGNYFNLGSELDNNGTLTIDNNGSLVQHNDSAINKGSVKVKRNSTPMRAFDFTYWSSPVAGQIMNVFSPETRFDKFYSYDPVAGAWVIHADGTDAMLPAVGYIMRAPASATPVPTIYNFEFNGVPNNGFIQTPIKIGGSNMNLIGNPYPSAINTISFLSNPANVNVVEGTIYLWTHNTQITNLAYTSDDYAVYNYSGSVATRPAINSGTTITAPTANIASGQSFFIKGLLNNSQVTFSNSMRVNIGNNAFFKTQAELSAETIASRIEQSEKNRVWLSLKNNEGAFKEILVGYIQDATNDIDRGYDGEAIGGNTYVNFYSTVNDAKLAIQGRALPFDDHEKISLGYNSTVSGTFEISIDSTDGFMESQNIYLEDKALGIIHDLKQSAYSFTTEGGTFDTRFELLFRNETLANADFTTIDSLLVVAVKDRVISVSSQLENINSIKVYDLLGRSVFETSKVGKKIISISPSVQKNQALIVKIVLENGQIATRKIIF